MHTFVQHLSILAKSDAKLGIIDGHWTSICHVMLLIFKLSELRIFVYTDVETSYVKPVYRQNDLSNM